MTITQQGRSTEEEDRRDALAGRLFRTCLDALDIWSVYLGHHLGYYRVLAERGPLTAGRLAEAAGTHERYAREWLEQQAATGILTVDEASADPASRRYGLGPGHAEVLLDRDSLSYVVPLVRYYQATALLIPRVVEAHRSGGGISWTDMGDEIRQAQEGFNRALFLRLLTAEDLPAVGDVDARLRAEPPARVADVGCGAGWSSIAIARAYPGVRVDGFDFDPAAIATAQRNAAEAGVSDRVRFEVHHADDPALAGRYDLVTFFECLHDLARPVEALAAARRLLVPGGAVIVMDEAVGDEFRAPASEVDRMMYGWSLVQCLPGGMADQPSAATGAVMRPATLRRYAEQAGYSTVEVLPIDNDPIRRWYRLRP
jgi:2-polyprenyl-3-methyl-5-hydroxy-6-metoxy-1,4-benzoquinol methylase